MSELAIVVMGYNRPDSLQRLLTSLLSAHIPAGTPLLISLDDSPNQAEVTKLAHEFSWSRGPKTILDHTEHLGLYNHYLACGDLTQTYRGIVLLEDDLVVARPFFHFAEQALAQFATSHLVAGVSLNSLWFNGYTHYRFTPILDDNDLFFLPIPWYQGQVLWHEQWQPFREWLADGNGEIQPTDPIHPSFLNFATDEWFPAYLKYLVETGRYFAFPRQSFTTNFGDVGTHFNQPSHHFHVPLQNYRSKFNLQSITESLAVYDSFFELLPSRLKQLAPSLTDYSLCVDLNSTKPAHVRKEEWLLTSQPSRRAERHFAMQRRPIEANVIEQLAGNGLVLTQTEQRRDDKRADWLRLYHLDRYYRRQRPASRWARLFGRYLE